MALFSFRKRASPPAGTDLRSRLMARVARKDLPGLVALVREHRDVILGEFSGWMTVPMAMQDDQRLLEQYGEMLLAVARVIERDGDASLVRQLEGDPADAPVDAWNEQIAAAAALAGQARFADAATVLSSLADQLAALRGSAVDFYRPRVLGKLGIALYQSGQIARAKEVTREARDLCQQLGDDEGVRAYDGNLQNMT